MAEEFRPFTEKDHTENGQYDTEIIGVPIDTIGIKLDGTLTGSPATVRTDAAFRLMGTPEVVQNEQPLVRMEAPDWRHLGALINGGYEKYEAPASAAGFVAQATLDFSALMPGAMINGAHNKVFIRGTFSDLDDYSGTAPSGITTGKLRPYAITSPLKANQGFRRPKFYQFNVDLGTASTDVQHKLDFDQQLLVVGLMVRARDDSAVDNVDGLIKKVRVDVNLGGGGATELIRSTWGQLRHMTTSRVRFSEEDVDKSVGVAMIPLRERRNDRGGGAFLFSPGDSVTLHFDTSATVEGEYTAVTPAGGDKAIITVVAFEIVAGQGDQGPDSVRPALSGASAVAPAVAARRRVGRAGRRRLA